MKLILINTIQALIILGSLLVDYLAQTPGDYFNPDYKIILHLAKS